MSTLDIIAALIAALDTNDTLATASLLAELDTRLPPEEVVDVLEAILGEAPPNSPHRC